jgi:hypothetical protein
MKTFASSQAGLACAGPGVKEIRGFFTSPASGNLIVAGQHVSMQPVRACGLCDPALFLQHRLLYACFAHYSRFLQDPGSEWSLADGKSRRFFATGYRPERTETIAGKDLREGWDRLKILADD